MKKAYTAPTVQCIDLPKGSIIATSGGIGASNTTGGGPQHAPSRGVF